MCVAVVKPIGAEVHDDIIRAMFDNNRDGAGFAFVDEGKVRVFKGFMTVDEFLKVYREYEEKYKDKSHFLLHFRIATAGKVGMENCHPFTLSTGDAMIHNGSFAATTYTCDYSDTRYIAEKVGPHLTKQLLAEKKEAIEKYIGLYNKMAFLHKDGTYTIINEKDGSWKNGVWYSNLWFKSRLSWDHQKKLGLEPQTRQPSPYSGIPLSPGLDARYRPYDD